MSALEGRADLAQKSTDDRFGPSTDIGPRKKVPGQFDCGRIVVSARPPVRTRPGFGRAAQPPVRFRRKPHAGNGHRRWLVTGRSISNSNRMWAFKIRGRTCQLCQTGLAPQMRMPPACDIESAIKDRRCHLRAANRNICRLACERFLNFPMSTPMLRIRQCRYRVLD
jgi:hypothetical protein